ncbi:maleylacetoacetate isomerase [Vibrio brasiliensis]|uniref:Maleylacetoacetate isomerase n=1 Tax=Vibrio brasiliensis LMG 20546 TaxID=945543 RepID=E8LP53_9VIBR|nr:maleylacetoacetate isomerase [Vibrio brasiliensis]EGA67515.1 maleylacetoacetate isomerase [Vibrio brasiliensis LMG 20546]MCG9752382.1 maleylacetoacetate isomerase [Vibrio brasiliensis]
MSDRILYGYWRSSAAYRVRIALNLKGLSYEQRSVHLVKNGGEQHSADFQRLNPNQLVPVLVDGQMTLNQSLAIVDYLDDTYPEVTLTPSDKQQRYLVKAMAQDIAVDMHPLNNLRVLQYLTNTLDVNDDQKSRWYANWIIKGFDALEQRLQQTRGKYSVGDQVTLVDVCLVPQVYNAKRFNVDLTAYPNILEVTASLNQLPAFADAIPEAQPDAV